jgi:phosphoglycolate phosphatase-like HAD superfamily hydrolase
VAAPDAAHLAVFDVDGVVADVRHRLHHLTRRPKDWNRFFAAAGRDPALPAGVELALEYAQSHVLVWLTGRPEHLRAVTSSWLARQGLPNELLFMRPSTDRRPAREFKVAQLALLGKESVIDVVVDDDPEVVTRLRTLGWPVLLADWVPYAETLREAEALRDAQERRGRT